MSQSFEKGDWIWIPHKEHEFLPAQVLTVKNDGSLLVKGFSPKGSEIKQKIQVDAAEVDRMDPKLVPGTKDVNDAVRLTPLTAAAVLHNVRNRFRRETIYTNVASILLSINPYEFFTDMYSEERYKMYAPNVDISELPPHIFGVCRNAYVHMREEELDNSFIISGESGSGKTEATKFILKYLTQCSNSHSKMEECVVRSTPILEAFGNAKTHINDNSSRFGKWIAVDFDDEGEIIGGHIKSYLLENSRVTRHAKNDRSFHIFYELCAGEEEKLDPQNFRYLNSGKSTRVVTIDDKEQFKSTIEALEVVGVDEETRKTMFEILKAILFLGNIEFQEVTPEQCEIKNIEAVEKCGHHLQCSVEQLKLTLTKKEFRASKRSSFTMLPLSKQQSETLRDSLAQLIYSSIFRWLVDQINTSLDHDFEKQNSIGILDIFGFEVFEQNGFEQLLINYANERLQQHFVQQIFLMEKKIYKEEGIEVADWEYTDNVKTCELFDRKPKGILFLIHDELNFPNGCDQTLLEKMHSAHGMQQRHAQYIRPRLRSADLFGVRHYPIDVQYSTTGFLSKSRRRFTDDLMKVISVSENHLVQDLFEKTMDDESSTKVSLGLKFRKSLSDLMASINATNPHFVRCIKPNSNKAPGRFNSHIVLNQLRTSGTLDTIKVRQIGYPHWILHEDFVERYGILQMSEKHSEFIENCKLILDEELKTIEDDEHLFRYEIGHSKVLFNETVNTVLETKRYTMRHKAALMIQTQERARVAKAVFVKKKIANDNLLGAIQVKDVQLIRQRIGEAKEVGLYERFIINAEQELERIIEEQRNDAAVAIQKIQRARMARTKFARLKAAQENLLQALDAQDPDLVESALQEAREVGLLDRLLEDGEAGKEQIIRKQDEAATRIQSLYRGHVTKTKVARLQTARDNLDQAVNERDIRLIKQRLAEAQFTSLLDRIVEEAQQKLTGIEYNAIVSVQSLARQRAAAKHYMEIRESYSDLLQAQEEGDVDRIDKCIEAARAVGVLDRFVDEAVAKRDQLEQLEQERIAQEQAELENARQAQLELERARELERSKELEQRAKELEHAKQLEDAKQLEHAKQLELERVKQAQASTQNATPPTSETEPELQARSVSPIPPLEHLPFPILEHAPVQEQHAPEQEITLQQVPVQLEPAPTQLEQPPVQLEQASVLLERVPVQDFDPDSHHQFTFVKQEPEPTSSSDPNLPNLQSVRLPSIAQNPILSQYFGSPHNMVQPANADEARAALQAALTNQSSSIADRIAVLTNSLLSASQFEIPEDETAPASHLCRSLSQILGSINDNLPKAAKSDEALNNLKLVVAQADQLPGVSGTTEIVRTKSSIRRYEVVIQHLSNAITSRNQTLLTPAYQNALALGISRPEVVKAQQLLEQLVDEQMGVFHNPNIQPEPLSPLMRPVHGYMPPDMDRPLSPNLGPQPHPMQYQQMPQQYQQQGWQQSMDPYGGGGYRPASPMLQPQMMSHDSASPMSGRKQLPQISPVRLDAVHQIIEAEKEYIAQLKVLEKVFRLRLATTTNTSVEILTQVEIDVVFSNVSQVLGVTDKLYGKMLDLKDKGADQLLTEIGQLFITFIPHFECYSVYNKQFGEASGICKELRQTNAKFGEFVKMNELCESMQLDDLLNAPHTHLSTYISLLKNLKEKTVINDETEKATQLESFTYQMAIERIEALISSTAEDIRHQREKDRAVSEEKEDLEIAAAQAALKAKVQARKQKRAMSQDTGSTPPKIPDKELYIMSDDDDDQRPPTDTDDDKEEEDDGVYNPQLPALKKLEDLITPPSSPPATPPRTKKVPEVEDTGPETGREKGKKKEKSKKKLDANRVQQRKREEIDRAKKMLAAQKQLPVLKGFVEKKSPALLGPWQRRYLTVAEYNVFYGKNKLNVTSAQYALNNDMNCIPLMVVNSIKVKKSKDSRQFVVQARDIKNAELREYLFKAKSTRDRDVWVAGLNKHKDHLAALLDCPAIRLNSVA